MPAADPANGLRDGLVRYAKVLGDPQQTQSKLL